MLGLKDILLWVTAVTERTKPPTRFRARQHSLGVGKDSLIGFRVASCNRLRALGGLQRDKEIYLGDFFLNSGNKIGE